MICLAKQNFPANLPELRRLAFPNPSLKYTCLLSPGRKDNANQDTREASFAMAANGEDKLSSLLAGKLLVQFRRKFLFPNFWDVFKAVFISQQLWPWPACTVGAKYVEGSSYFLSVVQVKSLRIWVFDAEVSKVILASCRSFCGFWHEEAGRDVLVLASGPSGLPQLLAAAWSGQSFPPSSPVLIDF